MVEGLQHVVVATVEGSPEIHYKQGPSDLWPDPTLPGLPYAVYSLVVDDVVWSEFIKPGDSIPVFLVGSTELNGGGPILPSEVLPTGTTYLLFMADGRPFDLPGFQAVRFVVSADGSLVPNGLECNFGGPAEISGITQEQCREAVGSANPRDALSALRGRLLGDTRSLILTAIAESPLPPTRTPYAAPSDSSESTQASLSPAPKESAAPSGEP
jgi:hypothetical protein